MQTQIQNQSEGFLRLPQVLAIFPVSKAARSLRSENRRPECLVSDTLTLFSLGQLGALGAPRQYWVCAAPTFSGAVGAVGANLFQGCPSRLNWENAARGLSLMRPCRTAISMKN